MNFGSIVRLGQESKIRLPDVDEVLDLGYASHAADDPTLNGTEVQRNARQIVARFMALEPRNDTEDAYLSCARAIMVSYGRALTRRKRAWQKSLQAAEADRERLLARIRASRHQNNWLGLAWRLLGPLILGLGGYLLAHVIGYFVPAEVASQTGNKLPSILLGLVFVFVGRSISYRLADHERNTIELQCKARDYQADIAYEHGKRDELRYYRARLCEAWKQYTGDPYPETASYEMIMAADIETRKSIERQRLLHNRTPVWFLRRVIRLFRRRRVRKVT